MNNNSFQELLKGIVNAQRTYQTRASNRQYLISSLSLLFLPLLEENKIQLSLESFFKKYNEKLMAQKSSLRSDNNKNRIN